MSSTTRTGEWSSRPGKRQVSSGSSASTVLMPTRIASLRARSRWPKRRASLAGDPLAVAGCRRDLAVEALRDLQRHQRPLLVDAQEKACVSFRAPRVRAHRVATSMPAARSLAMPSPFVRGSGSSTATTTRATPAAISDSAQGGVSRDLGARFERDIGGGAARSVAGLRQRIGFGVRSAAVRRPAAADDTAVASRRSRSRPTDWADVRPSPRRPSASAWRMWERSFNLGRG